MKNLILLLFCLSMASLSSMAQSPSLYVTSIFEGKVIPQNRMILTRVRGKTLSKFHLSYYRSARMRTTEAETKNISRHINKDKAISDKANLPYQMIKSVAKSSLIFALPPEKGKNRFICMIKQKAGRGYYNLTIIYMEGSLRSIAELNKLLP